MSEPARTTLPIATPLAALAVALALAAALPTAPATAQRAVHYPNCTAVRAAGAAPIRRGQPGYAAHLDRDGDGVACEPYRGSGGYSGRYRKRRRR